MVDVHAILSQYPLPFTDARVVFLGNHGGFSGARLWRIETGDGDYCLRLWPTGNPSPERLRHIHRCQHSARALGLNFVPAIISTKHGKTTVAQEDCLWEMTGWMPGRADFFEHPSIARMEAAFTALAQVHVAWSHLQTTARCPAVERRQRLFKEWSTFVAFGWRPNTGGLDPADVWLGRAWQLIVRHGPRVPVLLLPWSAPVMPLQPCLCDIWRAHVLFEGDRVTGIIDYGSIKQDHVAVDLARLLGSMAGDDAPLRAAGLQAYRRVRPITAADEALIHVLDETGTILGAANWLLWLCRDNKPFEDRAAVAARLAELVHRMEQWP